MAFHHVALATRDIKANHEFYTRAMGFRLVKVEPGRTPEGGRAKHLFYDTGGEGLIAFWEIQNDDLGEFDPAISTGLGLPVWANHLAWNAEDLDVIEEKRDRWLECGFEVVEIDHHWCVSIYTHDPNGILVEWCTTTREFSEADALEAEAILADPDPAPAAAPRVRVHRPAGADTAAE